MTTTNEMVKEMIEDTKILRDDLWKRFYYEHFEDGQEQKDILRTVMRLNEHIDFLKTLI